MWLDSWNAAAFNHYFFIKWGLIIALWILVLITRNAAMKVLALFSGTPLVFFLQLLQVKEKWDLRAKSQDPDVLDFVVASDGANLAFNASVVAPFLCLMFFLVGVLACFNPIKPKLVKP